MPVLDLKCHLQDENVNEIFVRPVLQALEERFRNYLDPFIKEFDPVPAAACLLTSENVLEAAKLWLVKEVYTNATQVVLIMKLL